MKKIFFSAIIVVGLFGIGNCAVRQNSDALIGPATATADVSIAAAGASKINCLEYLIAYSTSAYTVRILNGTTTTYAMSRAAAISHTSIFGAAPYCGSANTSMTLRATPDSDTGAAVKINYNGFIHKN